MLDSKPPTTKGDTMTAHECPDCGGTNNAPPCIAGTCLQVTVHTECDLNCTDVRTRYAWAVNAVKSKVEITVIETRAQISEGFTDHEITSGMVEYLDTHEADYTRDNLIILYARALYMLAEQTKES